MIGDLDNLQTVSSGVIYFKQVGQSDASNHSQSLDPCIQDSPVYQVVVPLVLGIIVLGGIVGNLMVIYVILSQPRLRTHTNLLLLNLAIADVSFLLLFGSFTTVHYALNNWPLGDPLCRIIQYLLYVTCYVTVYTLIAVSAVRYLTVVYGNKSAFLRSKRSIVLLIIAIWIVFLLTKIPILVVHGVSMDGSTAKRECMVSGKQYAQNLFATFFVFAYALPLLVICTLYILIIRHVKRKSSSCDFHGEERSRHITKVVVVVVTVFAVCWLPLHVHLLVAYYGKLPQRPHYKLFLLIWQSLAFANSLLNPLIYNYFSRDFRDGFRAVMHLRTKEIEGVAV